MARTPRAPWNKANPRKRAGRASTHLSSVEKSEARARARKAGRPYPNLVDNMRVAAKKKAAKKAQKTKTGGRKRKAKSGRASSAKSGASKRTTKRARPRKSARAR